MSVTCDECEMHVTDKEEFRFLFKKSYGNKEYDYTLSLCSKCFDNKFSIKRFAKFCSKENQHAQKEGSLTIFCCYCDKKIKKSKESHHLIRCFDSKIALEIYYCENCYIDDVGIE